MLTVVLTTVFFVQPPENNVSKTVHYEIFFSPFQNYWFYSIQAVSMLSDDVQFLKKRKVSAQFTRCTYS